MESTDQRHAPPGMPLAAQAGNGLGGGEQSLCGAGSKGADHRRGNGLDLSKENRRAGLDLVLEGGSVIGRAAFHDIAYVDVFTPEPQGHEHPVEELARSSDEGAALLVLFKAGTFTDEDQPGPRRALAENDRGPTGTQTAAPAVAKVFSDAGKSLRGVPGIQPFFTFDRPGPGCCPAITGQSLTPAR